MALSPICSEYGISAVDIADEDAGFHHLRRAEANRRPTGGVYRHGDRKNISCPVQMQPDSIIIQALLIAVFVFLDNAVPYCRHIGGLKDDFEAVQWIGLKR